MNLARRNFDFGIALCHLRDGSRVARAGWNGKGMWIGFIAGGIVTGALPPVDGDTAKPWRNAVMLPYLQMKTADDECVPWLASHTDLLASDWMLVE
jgi:hypothetical protein